MRKSTRKMFKLVVYVPETSLKTVKDVIFDADGGHLGRYKHCSWQVLGEGQFQPLSGSQPTIGQEGSLCTLKEWRLEVLVDGSVIKKVVAAMIDAHPYEEPAFEIYQCVDLERIE